MKVVVVGDVSWKGRYHLGDEAMTEAAIAQLRARGAEVTLVAGEPPISSEFYGVECVPIFGFVRESSRAAQEDRLKGIVAAVRGERDAGETDASIIEAVKSADAVVIAGGGNLNSTGPHHIYERVALKRVAQMAGVPLFVSSQTVGPHLQPRDREMVQEIAWYARVFGARERGTAALMREICGEERGRVVHTLDDALLLEPAENGVELRASLDLPTRFVLGSFTYHQGSTGVPFEEYYRRIAGLLDGIVAMRDVDIVLLPHMGVLGLEQQEGERNDVYGHDRIVHYSQSDRIRSLQMISARELLAVTAEAEFTVSTRYHPVIFGPAVGVPAVGIVTSYYSAQRMRGALANFGMESFALPFETWPKLFGPRLMEAMQDRLGEFTAHAREAGAVQRAYQRRWWDGIVASIAGSGDVLSEDVTDRAPLEWLDPSVVDLLVVARASQESINMYRMNNHAVVKSHSERLISAEKDLLRLRNEIESLHREVAELRHRTRPFGAALRDRIRANWRRSGRE